VVLIIYFVQLYVCVFLYETPMMVVEVTNTCRWILYDKIIYWCAYAGLSHNINTLYTQGVPGGMCQTSGECSLS